jgi:hypothetical protein
MNKTLHRFVFGALLTSTGLFGGPLVFTPISIRFNTPIGIDYHQPTNSVVFSVQYPGGSPRNFERIDKDGNEIPFSSISGFTDEVKIATVRSGNMGGFVTGELFTGNGVDGQIVRINPDGTSFINPWVDLPGTGNGLMRGSLYVDRSGVYGGDLLVATTVGQLWQVTSAGASTLISNLGVHLEGLMVIPNDAARWGRYAGKIIAGAENQGLLHVFDKSGHIEALNLGIFPEDLDLIEANANFFGVNYSQGRLLGVDAAQWTPYVGDIVVTQEFPSVGSGLYRLYYDPAGAGSLKVESFSNGSPFAITQWEHVTFAPAGIKEIPPTTVVPEPASGLLLLAGFGFAAIARRRTT